MPFYDERLTEGQLKRMAEGYRCNECGGILVLAWGGYYGINGYVLKCGDHPEHSTVAPKRTVMKGSGFDYQEYIRRSMELEETHGREVAIRAQQLPTTGRLNKNQAMEILKLVYPKCPNEEIVRCAMLCRDFGLHPLMKEVYLIPFKDKATGKENYATVLGINATRKLMAQRGTFSYLDMTPRKMTDEEQDQIFGEVDKANFVAITKLRTREGEEAQGYGKWPKDKQPYGTDKGNTIANMAFIRSERNAFGRLFTDAIPQNVEIVDEAYVEGVGVVDKKTGEVIETIEGEATELPPIEQTEPEPESDPEQPKSIVDIEWLRETLGELQKRGLKTYSDESMLNYMKITYKVEGTDVYDAASKLDKGKAAHLCKVLQDALDKA